MSLGSLTQLRPRHRSFAEHLRRFPDVFVSGDGHAALAPGLERSGLQARSTAVGQAMLTLREEGVIGGWRDELYPVLASFHDPPALLLERAAAPFFGIKAYGTATRSQSPAILSMDAPPPLQIHLLAAPFPQGCTSTALCGCLAAGLSCGWRGAAPPSPPGRGAWTTLWQAGSLRG